jgi:hypothetical protein
MRIKSKPMSSIERYPQMFRPVTRSARAGAKGLCKIVTLNPFDFHLTKEIIEFKLKNLRRKMLKMDIGEHDFYAHFSRDGKFQLTWRFGESDFGFYFCKNGSIKNEIRLQ